MPQNSQNPAAEFIIFCRRKMRALLILQYYEGVHLCFTSDVKKVNLHLRKLIFLNELVIKF